MPSTITIDNVTIPDNVLSAVLNLMLAQARHDDLKQQIAQLRKEIEDASAALEVAENAAAEALNITIATPGDEY